MNSARRYVMIAGAVLTVLAAGVWLAGSRRPKARRNAGPAAVMNSPADPRELNPCAPLRIPQEWRRPELQSRGAAWRYDVFTPPDLFLDETTGRIVVRETTTRISLDPAVAGPGIQLCAVERAPFPVQLLGWVGGNGHFVGSFEESATGERFLAGPGAKLERLGLSVDDIDIEPNPNPGKGVGQSVRWLASATVRDEKTGQVTRVRAGERCLTDELLAVVRVDDDEATSLHALREGEEIEGAEKSFRVDFIESSPPTATVVVTDDAAPEPAVLELAVGEDEGADDDAPLN